MLRSAFQVTAIKLKLRLKQMWPARAVRNWTEDDPKPSAFSEVGCSRWLARQLADSLSAGYLRFMVFKQREEDLELRTAADALADVAKLVIKLQNDQL